MRRFTKIALATAALAAVALTTVPAAAHTNIVVAGFQIAPGGYVSGYGLTDNQSIDEGPAIDGTVIWVNLDPVPHRFVPCNPCGANPQVAANKAFDVTIQPGERLEVKLALSLGQKVEYFDPSFPFMRGKLRVTSSEG